MRIISTKHMTVGVLEPIALSTGYKIVFLWLSWWLNMSISLEPVVCVCARLWNSGIDVDVAVGLKISISVRFPESWKLGMGDELP